MAALELPPDTKVVGVNERYNDGETPLYKAAAAGYRVSAKQLLRLGADPNLEIARGCTPILRACQYGYAEILRMLLDSGADPNSRDTRYCTALMWASQFGHAKLVRMLLDTGQIDINAQAVDGDTALHCAAAEGHLDVLHVFMDQVGVNGTLVNDKGQGAGELAQNRGHTTFVRFWNKWIRSRPRLMKSVSGTADARQPGDLCQYCENIAYHELPQENEPGLAHQPHLPALRESAKKCALCDLLLRGIYMTRQRIIRGGVRCVRYRTVGETCYCTDFGLIQPKTGIKGDSVEDDLEELDQMSDKFDEDFVNDNTIKPWLYGNWWRPVRRLRNLQWEDPDDKDLQLIGIGLRLGTSPDVKQGEGNDAKTVNFRGTAVRLRTFSDSTASDFVPGRLLSVGFRSGPALSFMKTKIEFCNRYHGCHQGPKALPTRILNVCVGDERQGIKLQAASGLYGDYAALSHCWGTDKPITTTTTNLEDRQTSIAWLDLPKTFQDAVWLTRELGLQYLWIDSLCILQDDLADWQREAPRMSEVYGNAFITFSASYSTDSHAGLFPPDLPSRKYRAQTHEARAMGFSTVSDDIPFRGDDGSIFSTSHRFAWATEYEYKGQRSDILLTPEWMPASIRDEELTYQTEELGESFDPLQSEIEHLHTRGWTLQERILSHRVLHFTVDRLYWECRGEFTSEDGSQFEVQTHDMDRTLYGQSLDYSECGLDWSQKYISLIEGSPACAKVRSGRRLFGWLQHVENFCSRQLSFESDRLPALSGPAKKIQDASNDLYLAGLWRNFLIEDLCWRTMPFSESRMAGPGGFINHFGPRLCRVTKPATYRAPTWSWASLNGHIQFVPLDFQHCLAKPVYTSLEPAVKGNFLGNMKSGWLQIEAPLLPIRLADSGTQVDRTLPLAFGTLCAMPTLTDLSLGEVHFDLESTDALDEYHYPLDATENSLTLGEPLESLETGNYYPYCGLFLDPSHCLVLRPVGTDMLFKRYDENAQEKGYSERVRTYERIGVGNFLRTEYQKRNTTSETPGTLPMGDSFAFTKGFRYGPIDEMYVKISAIIL